MIRQIFSRLFLISIVIVFGLGTCDSWTDSPKKEKIHRSHAAKLEFCKMTGYPGCHRPGYIVDHIKPLACGGADRYWNMQWQTKADALAKDKWERNGC